MEQTQRLYLARDGDRDVSLICVRELDVYEWDPRTHAFHLDQGLVDDFHFKRELTYVEVSAEQAAQLARSGLGAAKGRHFSDVAARRDVDERRLPGPEVLGPALTPPPSARARAAQIAAALRMIDPGQWVTYRRFPAESRQLAYVAAHDVRRGRIRALPAAEFTATARADPETGEYVVLVARRPPGAGPDWEPEEKGVGHG